MSYTHSKQSKTSVLIVCNLLALLAERGKTQKELALATGLLPARINRLAHKGVVTRIFTDTAIKICLTLSRWPRRKERLRTSVRLDDLFPMRTVGTRQK